MDRQHRKTDAFVGKGSAYQIIRPKDILLFVDLARRLLNTSICRRTEYRRDSQLANKVVSHLEQLAEECKVTQAPFYFSRINCNYFRVIVWLGYVFLKRFPQSNLQHYVIHEIPIEAIIRISGYGLSAFDDAGLLPFAEETWRNYTHRLANVTKEDLPTVIETDHSTITGDVQLKKIHYMLPCLQRYLDMRPELLDRVVPRIQGWDVKMPIDSNYTLYRHLENMMLLPPYGAEVMDAVQLHKENKIARAIDKLLKQSVPSVVKVPRKQAREHRVDTTSSKKGGPRKSLTVTK